MVRYVDLNQGLNEPGDDPNFAIADDDIVALQDTSDSQQDIAGTIKGVPMPKWDNRVRAIIAQNPSGLSTEQLNISLPLGETYGHVISSAREVITGIDVIWGSILEPRQIASGDDNDVAHALRVPNGATVHLKDLSVANARGVGIYVERGGMLIMENCWVVHNLAGGIYVEDGGAAQIHRCCIEHNGSSVQNHEVVGNNILCTNTYIHNHGGRGAPVFGDGTYKRCYIWSPVYFWEGQPSFDRCTFVQVGHPDFFNSGWLKEPENPWSSRDGRSIESGTNVLALSELVHAQWPQVSSAFNADASTGRRCAIPNSNTLLQGLGCWDYVNPTADITALDWLTGTFYNSVAPSGFYGKPRSVVKHPTTGALYECTAGAGPSSGTDPTNDTGYSWTPYATTFDLFFRYLNLGDASNGRENTGFWCDADYGHPHYRDKQIFYPQDTLFYPYQGP